jgi:hypothetical protein
MAVRLSITEAALRFPYSRECGSGLRMSGDRHDGYPAEEGFHSSRVASPVLIFGKLNLTTKEVVAAIGSIRIFQRLRNARWITALYPSRDALYPASQIIAAQQKMEAGEMPPLLPSEIKQRASSR